MVPHKARTLTLLTCGLAATFVGCGGSTTTVTQTVAATVAATTPTAPAADDEAQVRKVVTAYLDANAAGDYDSVCALFTPQLQRSAIGDHDSTGTAATCQEAFQAEEEDLGKDLAQTANQIYADAKIQSVRLTDNQAVVILDMGESQGGEPLTDTMLLQRDTSNWRIKDEG